MNLPLWIMPGLILLGSEITCTNDDDFKNTEFNTTPGLFCEKLGQFQTIGGTWQVKITLGKIKCKEVLKTFSQMLDKALEHCKESAQFRCHERIDYSRLQKQIDMAANIRSRLLEAVEEISSKSFKVTESLNLREKRQDNVTYFIETEEILLNGFNDNKSQIETNYTVLTNDETNVLNEYMIYQKINLILSKSSIALEKSIEEYIKYLEVMITVVHSLLQGKIHPYLFKRTQLINIIQKFRKLNHDLDFPCTLDQASVYDVLQVSRLSFKIKGDDLVVVLDIPLVQKVKYDLYRLHQTCVTQKILNQTGCAYIKPRTKFLVMDEWKMHYLYLAENILQNCHKIVGKYICRLVQAHWRVRDENDCEVQLLLNNNNVSRDTLKNCNVRVSFRQNQQWTAIVGLGGWLYSLPETETAEVLCKDKDPRSVIFRNTGFVRISPECSMKTKSVILFSLPFKDPSFEFVRISPIHLDLGEISTTLSRYYKSQENPIFSCPLNADDCSLLELENHLAMNDKVQYSSLFLIMFGCVITLLVILLILFGRSCWNYCYQKMSRVEMVKDNDSDNDSNCEEKVKVNLKSTGQENNKGVGRGSPDRVATKYSPKKMEQRIYV